MSLIRLEKVTRDYGRGTALFQALRGVDLTVEQGEFLAVMGPSGSGKSSTMNILGCLDTPSSGGYWLQGVAIHQLTRQQRALVRRNALGFIFQGFNLLARTTALENVELPLLYRGTPATERRRTALAALDQVGLSGWQHHSPAELSGGQQQRVAIARAIVTNPALLLADEPTGNLDTKTSAEIMALLTGLNENLGITIVMVTHEQDIAACAQRTVHFKDGLVDLGAAEAGGA